MQAIILAAGMGRRLGDLTKNNTKCMVKVNGVPLIDRLLTQLSHLELKRVVIVIGYEGSKLRNHIGTRYNDRLRIEYINNPVYDTTNNIYSLALAKRELIEDDTLLIESDLIFDSALFRLILSDPAPNVALVAKYQTWMDGTMVRIDKDCNIVNFVPKKAFSYEDAKYYYKTVNIYKFSRDFSSKKYVPFLEAYCQALGNNEYYEQVLRVITYLDNADLKALPIGDEPWYEIDDVQDLDIAETIFANNGEEKLRRLYSRYGGFWRFPGMLDFCYLVNPYFPTQRMIDEMRSNFDILVTEYPSGMKVNSLIAGKCFGIKEEYIVPGNGAAELIKSLMQTLDGKLGVIYPTFEEYPNRRNADSLEIFIPDNEGFRYSADDILNYFGDKEISSLLLINPDNPSGNFIPFSDLLRLAQWSEDKGIRFIVDESFVDFSDDYSSNTLLHNTLLESFPHMAVMKSISKSFGVPGLRLGILASADRILIDSIKSDLSIWNINSFAEFFMQIYSKYEVFYKDTCKKFVAERCRFNKELKSISFLKVFPSQANYFLCKVNNQLTSHNLAVRLIEDYNILIKDCGQKKAFANGNYIRIAIRNRKDNTCLINALKNIENSLL